MVTQYTGSYWTCRREASGLHFQLRQEYVYTRATEKQLKFYLKIRVKDDREVGDQL